MPQENVSGRQESPLIFIGLGSTGAKIVSQVRDLIWEEGDDWIKKWTYFTSVTSERNPEPGVSPRIDFISMSGHALSPRVVIDNFVSHRDPKLREQTRQWWPPATGAAGTSPGTEWKPYYPEFPVFDEGCAGFRPAGRLLFHHANLIERLRAIQTHFEKAKGQLQQRDPAAAAKVSTDVFYCYVFGLLAGGTCSGMFLDFAMLLATAIPQARIIGTFLLGDICYTGVDFARRQPIRERVQKRNTLLALAELFATHSLAGREIVFPHWPRFIGTDGEITKTFFEGHFLPYHEIALVGARRQNGRFLGSFEAYQRLVANYYGRLFLTRTHAQEAGRWVDDTQELRANLDRDPRFRTRANNVRFISYLSLTLPKRKTTALALAKVVDDMDLAFFRNADPQRRDVAVAAFRNAISWHDLDQFQPEQETFIPLAENDELPEKPDEFAQKWANIRDRIREHYQPWHNIEGAAAERQTQWEVRVREAFAALLDDLTGCSGDAIALGTLKAAIDTIVSETDALRRDLTRRTDELNRSLFTSEDGRESLFEKELAEETKNFPRGFFSGRRSWTGQNEVRQALSDFREELRMLCTAGCANKALSYLQNYALLVGTTRKLIVKRTIYTVFDDCRNTCEAIFLTPDVAQDVEQEILGDRQDIERILLPDVLDGPASAGGKTSVRQTLTDRLVNRCRSGADGRNLSGLFQEIVASLISNPAFATSHDAAWEISGVQRTLADFRNGLADSMDKARGTIREAMGRISVWDALRKVAERTDNPVATIENHFRTYGEMSQLFTKLAGGYARYGITDFPRTFICLCDTDEASECFSALGIREPDYLLRLFRGLGFATSPEIRHSKGLNEIVLFNSERGHEMRDIEEYLDLNLILAQPEIQAGDVFRWSDIRFPSWLAKLHEEDQKAVT